jgi:prophage regulatory protein
MFTSYRVLRLREVLAATGYSRSTIYRLMTERLWPKAVNLSKGCIGWPESEVAAMMHARIAGRDSVAIMALVAKLEMARELEPTVLPARHAAAPAGGCA